MTRIRPRRLIPVRPAGTRSTWALCCGSSQNMLPDFMNLIMNAPAQRDRLSSTFGDKIEPLGFDRFKTCELMAELLHCSNMGLLNELGAEELIASRDVERQRLRATGVLHLNRGPQSLDAADGLNMRMSHSSADENNRRLEVTNSSAEDDGFEEVTDTGDDDATHGVEDLPELPDAPAPRPCPRSWTRMRTTLSTSL